MQTSTTTLQPHGPRRAPGRRPCTIHFELAHVQHLQRLALEIEGDLRYGHFDYADLMRRAVAEFCAKHPTSRALLAEIVGASEQKQLPEPTPIEERAARHVAHVHASLTAAQPERSLCGLAGLGLEQRTLHPASVTCESCRAIVERNNAALAKPAKPRAPKVRAKKGRGR